MFRRCIKKMLFILICSICLTACSKKENNEPNKIISSNSSKIINDKSNGVENSILNKGLKDETLQAIGADEEGYGALGVNIRNENNLLLCKDPVYNIVYYVNYGEDYYIYRMKEGKSELVVELPAKRLFARGGKLYFIAQSYGAYDLNDMEGNILCYNPLTGDVSLIINDKAGTMVVYDDGIYYKTVVENEESSSGYQIDNSETYYYSFETKAKVLIEDSTVQLMKWKDYHVIPKLVELDKEHELYKILGTNDVITQVEGYYLSTLDRSKSRWLTDTLLSNYTIVEDKLYSMLEDNKFSITDIETAEVNELSLAIDNQGDFTIIKDKIYFGSLMEFDINTKVQSVINMERKADGSVVMDEELPKEHIQSRVFSELYTDGVNLYGLCSESIGSSKLVLRRIELIETNNTMNTSNEQGMNMEINRYVYRLLPMREE